MLKHEPKLPVKLQSSLKLKREEKHKKRLIDRLSPMRLQEFRQSKQPSHRLNQNRPCRMLEIEQKLHSKQLQKQKRKL